MYTVQNGLKLIRYNLKLLSLLPPPPQSRDNSRMLPYPVVCGAGTGTLVVLQVRQVLHPQTWHQGLESVPPHAGDLLCGWGVATGTRESGGRNVETQQHCTKLLSNPKPEGRRGPGTC